MVSLLLADMALASYLEFGHMPGMNYAVCYLPSYEYEQCDAGSVLGVLENEEYSLHSFMQQGWNMVQHRLI